VSRSGRVRVRDLRVTFPGTVALRDVDLDSRPGSAVALVGPNGSGKTTLLHVLAGLRRPDAGTVEVDGVAAYVRQRPDVHRWMPLTVGEVLRMGCYRSTGLLRRLGSGDRAVAAAAARLEVEDLRRRQFGELSGGQRQRVLVAQALVQRPDVLLLDEPVTGLDLASQQRILQIVAEETAAGRTVVLSTHHLEEARRCDHVVLLAGRVVAQGAPSRVLTPGNLQQAYGARALTTAAAVSASPAGPTGSELLVLDDHGHGTEAADGAGAGSALRPGGSGGGR
jgi:iron complex transport system ATP-binding protein